LGLFFLVRKKGGGLDPLEPLSHSFLLFFLLFFSFLFFCFLGACLYGFVLADNLRGVVFVWTSRETRRARTCPRPRRSSNPSGSNSCATTTSTRTLSWRRLSTSSTRSCHFLSFFFFLSLFEIVFGKIISSSFFFTTIFYSFSHHKL